jgi:hypothetical protein
MSTDDVTPYDAVPVDPSRQAAIRRLKAKRVFVQDLVAYAIVNAFLIGVWAVTGAGYFWPIWVLLGWGIALAMHAWTVYGRREITEADVQREMRRGRGDIVG